MKSIKGAGLSAMSLQQRLAWIEMRRRESVLGSCHRSTKSILTGVKCWEDFMARTLPEQPAYPPTLCMVQTWATQFSNPKSFGNYLGHLRTACQLRQMPHEVLNRREIKRAKDAIGKRNPKQPRRPLFVRRKILEKIVEWCGQSDRFMIYAKLFIFTYAFMLRLPSEALPAIKGGQNVHSSLTKQGDKMVAMASCHFTNALQHLLYCIRFSRSQGGRTANTSQRFRGVVGVRQAPRRAQYMRCQVSSKALSRDSNCSANSTPTKSQPSYAWRYQHSK